MECLSTPPPPARPPLDLRPSEYDSDSDVLSYSPSAPQPRGRMPGYLDGNQLVLDTPASAQPETQETMEIRLRELDRIRNTNTERYEALLAKRRHKDERTRLRREAEDEAFDTLDRSIHQEYSVYYCVVAPLVLPLTGEVGSSIQVPPSKVRPSPG